LKKFCHSLPYFKFQENALRISDQSHQNLTDFPLHVKLTRSTDDTSFPATLYFFSDRRPGLASAQLDFAYVSNPTNTWFTIQTFSQPITDPTLATWDTTSITDGDYILRLRVNLQDSTSQEVTVPIKIGNDFVPTPTLEPTLTPEADTVLIPTPFLLAASPTPTEVPRSTPTALPANPISLRQNQIYASLGRGALVILGLFALAGIIIRVRRY
jgi:hypothetical protein